jgi:hypothetical protein
MRMPTLNSIDETPNMGALPKRRFDKAFVVLLAGGSESAGFSGNIRLAKRVDRTWLSTATLKTNPADWCFPRSEGDRGRIKAQVSCAKISGDRAHRPRR